MMQVFPGHSDRDSTKVVRYFSTWINHKFQGVGLTIC